MATTTVNAPDADQERQRLIDEFIADEGPDWARGYEPGSFGCHELLDRTLLLAELVERSVLTHPACVQNRAWYELAKRAVDALQELYQRVGQEHLMPRGGDTTEKVS